MGTKLGQVGSSFWNSIRRASHIKQMEEKRQVMGSGSGYRTLFEGSLQNTRVKIVYTNENGPTGKEQVKALSKIVGREIRVLDEEGRETRTIGGGKGTPIELEYRRGEGGLGHWSLPGGVEPTEGVIGGPWDCLYDSVAHLTGQRAEDLKRKTEEMVGAVAGSEESLLGGARYSGSNPRDAGNLLDMSQRVRGHPNSPYGHPRGHASYPQATGPTESVEQYSMQGWKTGFLSRSAQDLVCHAILSSERAREAMERLNGGSAREVLYVSAASVARLVGDLPPPANSWVNGLKNSSPDFTPSRFRIILEHQQGQQNNPQAEVKVHTFFPEK